jgi:hypothetical protein
MSRFPVVQLRLYALLLSSLFLRVAEGAYAQGNLAVVFPVKNGRSTEAHPQVANLTDLWCQATNDGKTLIPIQTAKFVHAHPYKVHNAQVIDDRAHLNFGTAPVTAAGKYKCEITTTENEFVFGNLFVYLRPIFHVNGSRLDVADEEKPFDFTGPSKKAIRGERAVLICPVLAFPPPEIQWYKDTQPINRTWARYIVRDKFLHIPDVDDADEGLYRCVATNRFATVLDGPEETFVGIYDQQLRISGSLSWLVPLILILIILILLFIVIYVSRLYKRYRHDQYNVAQKEKSLRKAEQQRLRDENEEEDD